MKKKSAILNSLIGTPLVAFSMIPMVWTIVNGPHYGIACGVGAFLMLATCGVEDLLTCLSRSKALVACVALYSATTFLVEQPNTFRGPALFAGMLYAMVLAATWGKLAARFGMASLCNGAVLTHALPILAAAYAIQTIGPEQIIAMSDTGGRHQMERGYEIYGGLEVENMLFWTVAVTAAGTCMLGATFTRLPIATRVVALATVALGVWCNMETATRTVPYAAAIVVAALPVLLLLSPRASGARKAMTFGLWGLGLAVLAQILIGGTLFTDFLVKRIGNTQEDIRLSLWLSGLGLTLANPIGGGLAEFSLHRWAHNHVLDVGLEVGVLPALAVAASYVISVTSVFKLYRSHGEGELALGLLTSVIGVSLIAMTMPPHLGYYEWVVALAFFARARMAPPIPAPTRQAHGGPAADAVVGGACGLAPLAAEVQPKP